MVTIIMDAGDTWIKTNTVKEIIISLLSKNITLNEAMKKLEEKSEVHHDKALEKNILH